MDKIEGPRFVRFTEATAEEQSGTAVQVSAGGEADRWRKPTCRLEAAWATKRFWGDCDSTPAGAKCWAVGRKSSTDTAETEAA